MFSSPCYDSCRHSKAPPKGGAWYARQGSNLRPLESESNALIRLSYGRSICLFNISQPRRKSKGFDAVSALCVSTPLPRLRERKTPPRCAIGKTPPYMYRRSALHRLIVYIIPHPSKFVKAFSSVFLRSLSFVRPFRTSAYTTDRRNRSPVYIRC